MAVTPADPNGTVHHSLEVTGTRRFISPKSTPIPAPTTVEIATTRTTQPRPGPVTVAAGER